MHVLIILLSTVHYIKAKGGEANGDEMRSTRRD